MQKSGKVQIKEMAERLGLSAGTISIVLNGRGDAMRISKATQKRVWDLSKEMNYQPNIYARRLRSAGGQEASKVIAVFWNAEFTDDVMGSFFRGLYHAAQENQHNVEFYVQMFDYGNLDRWKNMMTASRFSGIICSGISDADMEFLSSHPFDLPVVLIGRNSDTHHCVYVNNYEIARNVAKLFSARGHKRAGLVSIQRRSSASELRHLGYLKACAEHGLQVEAQWVKEGDGRQFNSGYEAMKRLLKSEQKPTAVFINVTGQAMGALVACKEAGVRVPEDLELLAYGENETFPYYTPTVSCVYVPVESMAESALNLLILVLENGIDVPMGRMLHAQYAFRQSCGAFPKEA